MAARSDPCLPLILTPKPGSSEKLSSCIQSGDPRRVDRVESTSCLGSGRLVSGGCITRSKRSGIGSQQKYLRVEAAAAYALSTITMQQLPRVVMIV